MAAGIIETDSYLREPVTARSEDPFSWWEHKKNQYPRLYQLVLRRLCVCATSVSCERVFSKTGATVTEK
nr:unnamed protein product [Callosobruchus chinensis]